MELTLMMTALIFPIKEMEGSEIFWQGIDKILGVGCNEEVAHMGFASEVGNCVIVEEPTGTRLFIFHNHAL